MGNYEIKRFYGLPFTFQAKLSQKVSKQKGKTNLYTNFLVDTSTRVANYIGKNIGIMLYNKCIVM